jgi:hypothetical protein
VGLPVQYLVPGRKMLTLAAPSGSASPIPGSWQDLLTVVAPSGSTSLIPGSWQEDVDLVAPSGSTSLIPGSWQEDVDSGSTKWVCQPVESGQPQDLS